MNILGNWGGKEKHVNLNIFPILARTDIDDKGEIYFSITPELLIRLYQEEIVEEVKHILEEYAILNQKRKNEIMKMLKAFVN